MSGGGGWGLGASAPPRRREQRQPGGLPSESLRRVCSAWPDPVTPGADVPRACTGLVPREPGKGPADPGAPGGPATRPPASGRDFMSLGFLFCERGSPAALMAATPRLTGGGGASPEVLCGVGSFWKSQPWVLAGSGASGPPPCSAPGQGFASFTHSSVRPSDKGFAGTGRVPGAVLVLEANGFEQKRHTPAFLWTGDKRGRRRDRPRAGHTTGDRGGRPREPVSAPWDLCLSPCGRKDSVCKRN